jgi:hypothetical protein
MPSMNDRPVAAMPFWFASEIMPASATTVTPAGGGGDELLDDRQDRLRLGPFPPNAETMSGEPVLAGQQADGDLWL